MFDLYIDGVLVESDFPDRDSALLAAVQYALAGKEWAILAR